MKAIGWFLVTITGVTILYNIYTTAQNEREAAERPLLTVFSGGSNLKQAYTFTPPYTGFEVAVVAVCLVGIAIILISKSSTVD